MINHQVWDIPDFQTHPLSQQNRGFKQHDWGFSQQKIGAFEFHQQDLELLIGVLGDHFYKSNSSLPCGETPLVHQIPKYHSGHLISLEILRKNGGK